MAYDPVTESFYLGSLRKGKILKINVDGTYHEFVKRNPDGPWMIIGMKVDPVRRHLWVCSFSEGLLENFDPATRFFSGIFQYSLSDGTLIKKYTFETNENRNLFNDLTIAMDGTVFCTGGSKIFQIDPIAKRIKTILSVPDEYNAICNGIDVSDDDKYLYFAEREKIYRFDLGSKTLLELQPPAGTDFGHCDGLYLHKGNLLAISERHLEDKTSFSIQLCILSDQGDAIEEVSLLEKDNPLYSSPTTGAIVDNKFFFIGVTHLAYQGAEMERLNKLSDIYILKLDIR